MEKFDFFYFESGAYLRRMAETHPDLKKTLDAGKIVPDKEFTSYLAAYLDSQNLYDNIIFDGFPRTVTQYEFFKNWLADKHVRIDLVIDLTVSEKVTIERLSARRMDPATGKIYNLITDKPPADVDKKTLIQREDDKPEAIKKRLAWYRSDVEPLIELLKRETEVVEVDGERPVDVISRDLVKLVEERMK
jgi:adenylate kinase